ncbi:PAS domain S-box protein [Methanoplanus limicola]|uniref:histidine kinase n=1 Tax=Methanoplanus limicola DSM 2279 TaxID=937775 RepID=H1Z2M3_9EURY|nr:PAS domain S-box protein [Methanoplanus limicola]EHQ36426.1 multi-sensor signal transduction histidine kinase [Methanoplanus limicola DSM 2279]
MISVLYTDDEPALLEIGKIFLEKTGDFTVKTATGADEALNLLEKEKFDVIVSDYQMPKMDGIEFLIEVRERYGDIPFILFTGKGREEIVIQAINSGANFYLQKGGEPKSQFAELSHKIKSTAADKKTRDALRQSEEQSGALLSAMPEPVLVHQDGIIVYANPVASEISGYQNDEVIGQNLLDFIPEENREPIALNMAKRISGDTLNDYEVDIKGKYGDIHHAIVRTAPLIFNGSPSTVVILADITKRSREERKIRESEALYRAIFENTGTGTIIFGEDTIILKVNEIFSEMSGYSRSEIEGKKSWTEFVAEEDRDRMLTYGELRLKEPGNKDLKAYEFRFTDRSGKVKECINNVGMIAGTDMSVASIVDISYKKDAERELKEKNEDLKASNERLSAAEEELKKQIEMLAESENALRMNEERLIMAQEIGNIGCWEYNPDNGKIWASAETMRIFGLPEEDNEILPDVLRPCIPGWEPDTKSLNNLIERAKEYDVEFHIQPADGSELKYVNLVAKIITDRNTGQKKIMGIIRDITEENAGKEELNLKNYAIDSATDAIGIGDLSGNITYANPAFLSIMGYDSPDEVIGSTFRKFPYLAEEGESVYKAIITHGSWSGEIMGKKKDGTPKILWFNANMIRNDSGQPLALMFSFRDITDLKRTEEALKKSEEKYRSIFENANDQIIIHKLTTENRPGIITEANKKALDTLGYTPDEILKLTIADISRPQSQEEMTKIGNVFFNSEKAIFPAEQIAKDGHITPVEVSTKLIESEGEPEAIAIIRDLSERKKAEEALIRAHNLLKLITGITRHDIKNQITALTAYLELTKFYESEEKIREYIDKADIPARNIVSIIEKTKSIESIGIDEPVWQDLHTTVKTAAEKFSQKGVVITNDLPSDIRILTDPVLDRVYYNLIENSLRHGGDITEIRFFGEKSGDDYLIIYSDDGRGIADEEKEKIFEKNYGHNTGLGLYFTREILAITGISIRENGIYGRGARFEIRVPEKLWEIAKT